MVREAGVDEVRPGGEVAEAVGRLEAAAGRLAASPEGAAKVTGRGDGRMDAHERMTLGEAARALADEARRSIEEDCPPPFSTMGMEATEAWLKDALAWEEYDGVDAWDLLAADASHAAVAAEVREAYGALRDAVDRDRAARAREAFVATLRAGMTAEDQADVVARAVRERLEEGPRPSLVSVTGPRLSGRTRALDRAGRQAQEAGTRLVRVQVPAPYTSQAMGVSILAALDFGYDGSLDGAADGAAWNAARRLVRDIDLVLVDDLDAVRTGASEDDAARLGASLRSLCAAARRAVLVVTGAPEVVADVFGRDGVSGADVAVAMAPPSPTEALWLAIRAANARRMTLGTSLVTRPGLAGELADLAGGASGRLSARVAAACARAATDGRSTFEAEDLGLAAPARWPGTGGEGSGSRGGGA